MPVVITPPDSTAEEPLPTLSSIVKRLTGDTLIYGLGATLSRTISFFLLPLYTAVLAPAEYATVDVLLTLNAVLFIITKLGIDSGIALIFQQEDPQLQRRMITSSMLFQFVWALLFASTLIFFARPMSGLLLRNVQLAGLITLSFVLLPAQSVLELAQGVHKWKREPLRFALIAIGLTAFTAGLNAWFLLGAHLGVVGVLLGIILANVLFAVIGVRSVSRYLGRGFASGDVWACLSLGAPFALAGLLNALMPNINRLFLVNWVGLTGTGLYASGLKLCMVLVFVSSAFDLAYAPYVLSIQKSPHARIIYAMVGRLFPLMLILAAAAILVSARPLLEVVLRRPEYAGASSIIGPLLLAFWIQGVRVPFQMGLIIARKSQHYIWAYVGAVLASVILNAILVPFGGIVGAAWAAVGVELTLTVILFYFNQREYYVPYAVWPIVWLAVGYLGLMWALAVLPKLNGTADLGLRMAVGLVFLTVVLLGAGAVKHSELKSGLHSVWWNLTKTA